MHLYIDAGKRTAFEQYEAQLYEELQGIISETGVLHTALNRTLRLEIEAYQKALDPISSTTQRLENLGTSSQGTPTSSAAGGSIGGGPGWFFNRHTYSPHPPCPHCVLYLVYPKMLTSICATKFLSLISFKVKVLCNNVGWCCASPNACILQFKLGPAEMVCECCIASAAYAVHTSGGGDLPSAPTTSASPPSVAPSYGHGQGAGYQQSGQGGGYGQSGQGANYPSSGQGVGYEKPYAS